MRSCIRTPTKRKSFSKKNLYLTNSIKSSLGEEKIENKELKKLVTKKNLLSKRIAQLSKDIFNEPEIASNSFAVQSKFKKEITEIDSIINTNFPD